MSYTGAASAYRTSSVMGSSREQLVVLMYEHLLASLRRAALQIEASDIEGRATSLGRASDIVFELLAALDRERGGEVAGRLAALYAWFLGEIGEVGRTPDTQRLGRLIDQVATLHGAWVRAASSTTPVASTEGELLA